MGKTTNRGSLLKKENASFASRNNPMNDEQIRNTLRDIDENEDIDVSSWEAEFIEGIVYDYEGPLSEAQRIKAKQIIEKYEEQYK